MAKSIYRWSLWGLVAAALGCVAPAHAADPGAITSIVNPLSGIFGEKDELQLREAINYPACFEYKEKTKLTVHPKCRTGGLSPVPAPVYKYTVEYTEPTVMVETVFQPGGGVLETESSLSGIEGQGGLSVFGAGDERSATYVGNQNPMMPTLGRMPNVYFDAHVWGVGPLGFLEATKGEAGGNAVPGASASDIAPTTVTDALPAGPSYGDVPVPGLVGETDLTAMKSMICWLAEAEKDSKYGRWFPDPLSASTHLKMLSLAPEVYVRARLANWGSTWFNQAGTAQVQAKSAGGFLDSFGDNSSLLMAGAGALIGYAMTKKDGATTCNAQRQVTEANQAAQAQQAAVQESIDEYAELMPEATYLPAGFDQQNVGYDTCPLTGTGHYVDDANNIHFVNCDPEERVLKVNCSTGQSELVDNAPGTVNTWLNPQTNPCAGGQGQKFGSDPHVYVRAPSCVKRLSSFQEEGKYLACDSQSTTYASCGKTVSGTGSMPFPPPINGARPSAQKTGSFSICTAPSGTRTVNQLAEYNQLMQQKALDIANGTAAGMAEAQRQMDSVVAQQGASCTESGGNNGLMGAAVGAAAGFGLSQLTGNIGNVTSGISNVVGGVTSGISGGIGQLTQGIGQFSGQITQGLSNTLGSVTGGINGALGGAPGTLGDLASQGSGIAGQVVGGIGQVNSIMSGSTSAMLGLAEQFGVIPEGLRTVLGAFNQDKLIPLYISEQDQTNWRSSSPASRMLESASMMSVPLAGGALGFSSNAAGARCGEVGVWGMLCPLRGFVETSGNNLPASGLAGWRAYHKALAKVPDRKRMQGRATAFNLDYPHQSSCYEIGEDGTRWDGRGQDDGGIFDGESTGGGGLGGLGLSSLFGDIAGGLGNIVSQMGTGNLMGGLQDKRIEKGVFVYTYWKETKCSWKVCSMDGKVLSFDSDK